jgi:mannose-1-phosphate guanylyltransferase
MLAAMNVVIMAGGGGTRLWPVSRRQSPKQFLKVGEKTLLQQAYQRARALTKKEDIFVATLAAYQPKVAAMLKTVPPANVLYEPARRDTTAAFAAVAVRLQLLGRGEEPTIFLWSDHLFVREEEFLQDMKKIPDLLEEHPDSVVIMGHVPAFPETGFGYIEAANKVTGYNDVFQVKKFLEKPKRERAEELIRQGNCYWNMGYFSFKPNYFLKELRRLEPGFSKKLDQFAQAVRQRKEDKADTLYRALPAAAVEYTFMEKTPRVLVVTGDYGWNDVGNWAAMNAVLGLQAGASPLHHYVHVDAEENFVYNTTKKMVTLIGVKDTIVVVTKDAILITSKKDAPKVKELVMQLEKKGQEKYL